MYQTVSELVRNHVNLKDNPLISIELLLYALQCIPGAPEAFTQHLETRVQLGQYIWLSMPVESHIEDFKRGVSDQLLISQLFHFGMGRSMSGVILISYVYGEVCVSDEII